MSDELTKQDWMDRWMDRANRLSGDFRTGQKHLKLTHKVFYGMLELAWSGGEQSMKQKVTLAMQDRKP